VSHGGFKALDDFDERVADVKDGQALDADSVEGVAEAAEFNGAAAVGAFDCFYRWGSH
jgi:hypothetical protein